MLGCCWKKLTKIAFLFLIAFQILEAFQAQSDPNSFAQWETSSFQWSSPSFLVFLESNRKSIADSENNVTKWVLEGQLWIWEKRQCHVWVLTTVCWNHMNSHCQLRISIALKCHLLHSFTLCEADPGIAFRHGKGGIMCARPHNLQVQHPSPELPTAPGSFASSNSHPPTWVPWEEGEDVEWAWLKSAFAFSPEGCLQWKLYVKFILLSYDSDWF